MTRYDEFWNRMKQSRLGCFLLVVLTVLTVAVPFTNDAWDLASKLEAMWTRPERENSRRAESADPIRMPERFVSLRNTAQIHLQRAHNPNLPFDDGTVALEHVLGLVEEDARQGVNEADACISRANSDGTLLELTDFVRARASAYLASSRDINTLRYGLVMLFLPTANRSDVLWLQLASDFYKASPEDPRACFLMSNIYARTGRPADSIAVIRKLQARPNLDQRISVMCYLELGSATWRDSLADSLQYYMEGLRVARLISWGAGEGNALSNWARTLTEQKNFETIGAEGDAETMLRRSIEISAHGQLSEAARADDHLALARLYRQRMRPGDADLAVRSVDEARRLFLSIKDTLGAGKCREERGHQLWASGNHAIALEELVAAAEIYRESRDPRREAKLRGAIAGWAYNAGRPIEEVRVHSLRAQHLYDLLRMKPQAEETRILREKMERLFARKTGSSAPPDAAAK